MFILKKLSRIVHRYSSIWVLFAKYSVQQQLSSQLAAFFFFVGKVFRFVISIAFILLLRPHATNLMGYTFQEVIVFFLVFTLIDTLSQMIMRGVYSFEPKIRTGAFDFTLTKPLNPLFQALIGSPDFNDVLAAIPLFGFSFWYLIGHGYFAEMGTSLLFLLYLANGMLIAAAFHIFVLCVGIAFLEVDNAVWMYRDIIQMGRFPIDIYREPMRWIVTFIVPTGIMISYPARELIGKASNFAWIGLVVGVVLFVLSLLTWKRALKAYSSASS